jgi:hypothetical protein
MAARSACATAGEAADHRILACGAEPIDSCFCAATMAKALGLSIPESFLLRADEVIE